MIAILTGLLLPAVQQTREAAARTQCSDNLKQIGLAIRNFEKTNQKLPRAFYYTGHGEAANGYGFTRLLPYIEQDKLADKYSWQHEPTADTNQPVVRVPIKAYKCPSART